MQHARTRRVAAQLAARTEEVCRQYLPAGRRSGGWWLVGDRHNTPGRSLFVRLTGEHAGRWTDAATGEFGDLLDLIAGRSNLFRHADVLAEAEHFLGTPSADRHDIRRTRTNAPERLLAQALPLAGTLGAVYLHSRGLDPELAGDALRFLPRCRYRHADGSFDHHPALVAAVTDDAGNLTGIQRTYLAADGCGKAAVPMPRKALGQLRGHGVRFGDRGPVLLAGEGLETVLSLKLLLPTLPMVAALGMLGALMPPPGVTLLYLAVDRDAAGLCAAERLARRCAEWRIATRRLAPARGDFNDDLCTDGAVALAQRLAPQLRAAERSLLTIDVDPS